MCKLQLHCMHTNPPLPAKRQRQCILGSVWACRPRYLRFGKVIFHLYMRYSESKFQQIEMNIEYLGGCLGLFVGVPQAVRRWSVWLCMTSLHAVASFFFSAWFSPMHGGCLAVAVYFQDYILLNFCLWSSIGDLNLWKAPSSFRFKSPRLEGLR